jgi:hypothetical protein
MDKVIITGADQERRLRAGSVLRIVRETRKDLLDHIESLEDYEGNLDIHCYENTSNEKKEEIVQFFTKVWELHNECSVWIHPPISQSIWVNVYRNVVGGLYSIHSFSCKEFAIESSVNNPLRYVKTIEIKL